MIYIVLQ